MQRQVIDIPISQGATASTLQVLFANTKLYHAVSLHVFSSMLVALSHLLLNGFVLQDLTTFPIQLPWTLFPQSYTRRVNHPFLYVSTVSTYTTPVTISSMAFMYHTFHVYITGSSLLWVPWRQILCHNYFYTNRPRK